MCRHILEYMCRIDRKCALQLPSVFGNLFTTNISTLSSNVREDLFLNQVTVTCVQCVTINFAQVNL